MINGESDVPRKGAFLMVAILHILCCGIPLLVLSGVSLTFLAPAWPLWGGALAVLGVVGFVWYVKRGCATCPRNEACEASARAGETERSGIETNRR